MTTKTPDNRTVVASEEVFSVLANDQRRVALQMLADTDEPILDLDSLVEQVSGRLHSEDPSMDQYRRTRIALHHNHLPKLDEYGMVVYDPDAMWFSPR